MTDPVILGAGVVDPLLIALVARRRWARPLRELVLAAPVATSRRLVARAPGGFAAHLRGLRAS